MGKLIGEASDDEDAPAFGGQTPEETTYDRQGPLLIPSQVLEVSHSFVLVSFMMVLVSLTDGNLCTE